jgi:putative hydroxymethylpyrimidine transporter CytX
MDSSERSWGTTPVPERLRSFSFLDTAALWGNLGISLLVLVAGALLVPALGLDQAIAAIVVGAAIGCALLGLAGLIGAERRVPGMVLLRDPLGRRGSYLPTALNVFQNLGWATFELIVIATAASALADELFGFRATWVWTVLFGALVAWMALAGPISVVRRYVRRFAVPAVVASVGYLTWWAVDRADLRALWDAPGEGGLGWWQGVDLTIGMAASWLPLAADYTRFSTSGRAAFWGTSLGYFVALVWLFALGAVIGLGLGLTDPTTILAVVAGGGAAAAVALFALTVDEADEPFANVYSAAVSLQNFVPAAPQKLLILGCSAIAVAGALTVDLFAYQSFLFLLGSFFVPLFGVLAADYVLGRSAEVAVRWGGLAAWIAGFALYQWIQPTGPEWWTSFAGEGARVSIGASLPAFAASFALYVVVRAPAFRRSRAAVGSRA